MDSKEELRKRFLVLRRDIVDRETKNKTILEKLLKLDEFCSAKKIFCYAGIGGEVDTKGIFEYCIANKIEIYLPVILEDGIMCGQMVETVEDIKYYNPTTHIADDSNRFLAYDVIISPLVAVDTIKTRLGRGGGYYDKFLAAAPRQLISIGLAYDEQVSIKPIPAEFHDRPLDIIITPTKVIK